MWQLCEDNFTWNCGFFTSSQRNNELCVPGKLKQWNCLCSFIGGMCVNHTLTIYLLFFALFLCLALLTEFDPEVFHVFGGFMQMSLSWSDKLTVLQSPGGKEPQLCERTFLGKETIPPERIHIQHEAVCASSNCWARKSLWL